MYRNVTKTIKVICWILAIVSFVGFLALGVIFLISALMVEDTLLRDAGIQGAVVSLVAALVLPLFTFPLYGFALLIESNEKQSENTKEIKELLKQALADGALAEDMARQLSVVLAKMNPGNAAAPIPRAVQSAQAAQQAQPAAPKAEPTPETTPVQETAAAAPVESVRPPRPLGGERAKF